MGCQMVCTTKILWRHKRWEMILSLKMRTRPNRPRLIGSPQQFRNCTYCADCLRECTTYCYGPNVSSPRRKPTLEWNGRTKKQDCSGGSYSTRAVPDLCATGKRCASCPKCILANVWLASLFAGNKPVRQGLCINIRFRQQYGNYNMPVGSQALWRSVVTGCLITGILVGLAIAPIPGDLIHKGALWLLSPGILAGFGIGSGHVHDVRFWLLTATINGIFYTGIAYVGFRMLRSSASDKQDIR
jgi:hypothetical protein